MAKKFWVALPGSLLTDEPTLREKTDKIGWIGRCLAIFGVQKLFIYHEREENRGDSELMKLLLEYMETPPYLRKALFPIREELRYAGLLPPLRTPHHMEEVEWERVAPGMVRQALVMKEKDGVLVEVGLSRPVEFEGVGRLGERLMVTFTQGAPNPRCRRAKPEEVNFYVGYTVTLFDALGRVIRSSMPDLSIATSRLGRPLQGVWSDLVLRLKSSNSILMAFGSPHNGLHDIAKMEGWDLGNLSHFVVNLYPNQHVATIRTEEALLGGLSLINFGVHSMLT